MGAFDTIASIIGGSRIPKAARAYIIPLNGSTDTPESDDQIRCFQYFPETINDSKGADWDVKKIPGLSHPLYSWVSGSERSISFTATFTRDTDIDVAGLNARFPDRFNTSINNVFSETSAFETSVVPNDLDNVDIPGAVAWLRQFLYPRYTQGGVRAERSLPPKKLVLVLPNVRLNYSNQAFGASELPCIMRQCDVTHEGFFSSGTPRITRIALSFDEIIQLSGNVTPQDAVNVGAIGGALYKYNPIKKKA